MGKHLLTAFVVLVSAQFLSGQGNGQGNAPFLSGLQRVEIRRTITSSLNPGIVTFGQGNDGCPVGKKIISFACRIPEQLDGIEFHGSSFNNDELTQMGCGVRLLRPFAAGEFEYRITLVCAEGD